MIKFIVFLFSTVTASPGSDFLKGFLTGFHGTDVIIGEFCLDPVFISKTKLDAVRLFDDLKEKQYFRFMSHMQLLISDLVTQSNECHLPDIWRIIESFNSIGIETMLYRIFCNLLPIIRELEEASPNNLYTFGFHLAKAIKFLEKEDSHPPSIDTDQVSQLFEGFLTGLIPQTPSCSHSLHDLGTNIQKLLNSSIFYLNGDDTLLPFIQYQSMVVINSAVQVEFNCKALSLLQLLFESLVTREGFVKAYLRFGMKYEEIQTLSLQADLLWKEEDFKGFGELWGKIVGKIIQ